MPQDGRLGNKKLVLRIECQWWEAGVTVYRGRVTAAPPQFQYMLRPEWYGICPERSRYGRGWTYKHVLAYCKSKGWIVTTVTETWERNGREIGIRFTKERERIRRKEGKCEKR